MGDDVVLSAGTADGARVSTEEVTTLNGGAVTAQHVQRFLLAFRTADGTAVDVPGDVTNGVDVDVTRLPSLPAGSNNIGDVDVLTEPATAADGAVGLPAVAKVVAGYDGANVQALNTDAAGRLGVQDGGTSLTVDDGGGSLTVDGTVAVSGTVPVSDGGGSLTVDGSVSLAAAIPAGTNNIGDVDVASLPAVALDSATLTALETTELGATTLAALESITIGTALPAGTNAIGKLAANAGVEIGDVGLNAASLAALESITVVNGGTFVTQENGAALTALQLLDDTVFADDAAFTPGTSKVNAVGALADETSTDSVDEGDIGILRMTLNRLLRVTQTPATSGGLTPHKKISAASTNGTSLKASAGQVYAATGHNTNAAVRYLKLYDKASAPTVGTDTPVLVLPIPGNTAGAGFVLPIPAGVEFTLGIAYAITTGVADSDTGAVAANELVVNLLYK